MSLVDDARKLTAAESDWQECPWCHEHQRWIGEGVGGYGEIWHRHGCASKVLTKIVAALEAAEAVARAYERETVATFGTNLGSPLLAAVDALDKALKD